MMALVFIDLSRLMPATRGCFFFFGLSSIPFSSEDESVLFVLDTIEGVASKRASQHDGQGKLFYFIFSG